MALEACLVLGAAEIDAWVLWEGVQGALDDCVGDHHSVSLEKNRQ
jgi:hypothetical protein